MAPTAASPTTVVDGEILGGGYAASLLYLSSDQVIDFWCRHMPPHLAGALDKGRQFQMLLTARTPVDVAVVNATLDNLGAYLCRQGYDPRLFVREMLGKVHRGLPASPALLLKACGAFLRSLVLAVDMRAFMIEHLQDFANVLTPGIGHRRLVRRTHDDWATDLIGAWGPVGEEEIGQWRLPSFNLDLWVVEAVTVAPSYLGLPPFEESFMLCDSRDISAVVPDAEMQMVDDTVVVDGRTVGRLLSWKACRTRLGLPDTCPGDPERRVVLVHTEVRCPRCGRVVLHERCAYGAPLYIYGLHYRRLRRSIGNSVFHRVLNEALRGQTLHGEVERRQKQVLQRLRRKKTVVTYHAADDSVSIDGRHVVRAVPARMLRTMLRGYIDSGRTEFEYREFSRDNAVGNDSVSPNISIRAHRLVSALKKNAAGVLEVTRVDRGRLRLIPRCSVEFREDD